MSKQYIIVPVVRSLDK